MKRLNPIQQRLYLYGFAHVQITTFGSIHPAEWGLPGLQILLTGPGKDAWTRVWRHAWSYRAGDGAPLVSANLAALRRIRVTQPRRPLIYCQTPFGPPRTRRHLGTLPRRIPGVAAALWEADPFQPLYWLPALPSPRGRWVAAYQNHARHPLARQVTLLRRQRPQSQFTIREDGLVQEQLPLFAGVSLAKPIEEEAGKADRLSFENAFCRQMGGLEGRFYICAKNRESLAWFQRDCLRLLGNRYRCWRFPRAPDPRDPLVHFILATDAAIAYRALERNWPLLHLDGGSRLFRYRHARRLQDGPADWRTLTAGRAWAVFSEAPFELLFSRGPQGWESYRGACLQGDCLSTSFNRKISALQELCPARFQRR